MLTITIEVSRGGIGRVRVPVCTLTDQAEARTLFERIAVPLDLLNRAAQNFPADPEPVSAAAIESVTAP